MPRSNRSPATRSWAGSTLNGNDADEGYCST
jgi:hypothetical protein